MNNDFCFANGDTVSTGKIIIDRKTKLVESVVAILDGYARDRVMVSLLNPAKSTTGSLYAYRE
ncbi:MAG: hypothetical protein LBH60_02310 [Prevotellaceae bacterium]|nr:hypothetical protein [Prevotellaceae bacterium]